jgi:hypothetical protein
MEFLRSLAFLANLTPHFNALNLKLQGKGQNTSHLVGHIKRFHKEIKLFEDTLQKNYITHFPACQELKENKNDLIDFAEFKEVSSEISEEFHTKFMTLIP